MNILSKDYNKMSTEELEKLANDLNIGEYFDGNRTSRNAIITQLRNRDNSIKSTIALILSIISIVFSFLSLLN